MRTTFKESKGEVGPLINYKMRSWLGWHQSICCLVSMAHYFLVRLMDPFLKNKSALDHLSGPHPACLCITKPNFLNIPAAYTGMQYCHKTKLCRVCPRIAVKIGSTC